MGFMSSRALICTIAASILLTACSKDEQQVLLAEEVNNLNIYFSQVEENGTPVGKIFSFNPDNGSRIELASYSAGANNAITMDTDEDEPGYDMAAFIDGSTLKVLDYRKDARRRIYSIQSYTSDICGIYPSKIPADSWDTGESNYSRTAIEDTAVFVALKTNNSCATADVAYQYVKFDLSRNNPLVVSRYSSGVRLNGAYFYDTSYRGFDPDENGEAAGRVLWIGYDKDREAISIQTRLGISLAEASLAYVSAPPIVQSPIDGVIIIQAEGNLYKLTLEAVNLILEAGEQASANNLLESILSIPVTTYNLADESQPIKLSGDASRLAFSDDDGLYQMSLISNAVTTVYSFPVSLTNIEFAQTRTGPIVALKEFPTYSALSLFSTDSGISEVQIVPQADVINFREEDTNLYINTLNATSIGGTSLSADQWVAAKTELSSVRTTYPNSQLVFLDGRAGRDDQILILKSSETDAQQALPTPRAFLYDPNSFDGITVFTTEEADTKESSEAFFGTLSTDVRKVIDNRLGANYILNSRYAGFLTTDETSFYGYFIDPYQGSSLDGTRQSPTLQLIDTTDYDPVSSYFSGFFPGFAESLDYRTSL